MKFSRSAPSDQIAEKFRRMLGLDSGGLAAPPSRALVHVVGGLHAGARIKLERSPTTIGNSLLSDIVLKDSNSAQGDAEIVFDDDRWSIRTEGTDQTLPILCYQERGRFLRERIDLGDAKLVLSQSATESAKAQHLPSSSNHQMIVALTIGALVLAGTLFVNLYRSNETDEALQRPGLAEIDLSAWPDISVSQIDDGSRRISGYVDNIEDRQALLGAIDWRMDDDVTMLRSGDQLAIQLREVLDSDSINVRYVGSGTIRLTGEVADQVEFERINWIMDEYEEVMFVDNLTEFVPAPREPVRRALPFKIVDVIPGANGSFGDQNGNRYFIGARLTDGSTLLAVHEDGVEFEMNNEPLLYPIK